MTDTSASVIVPASPDAVVRTVTDIGGLPSWNQEMTSVIDQPTNLEAGAEWVVEFHVLGPGAAGPPSMSSTSPAGGSRTDPVPTTATRLKRSGRGRGPTTPPVAG